MSQEIGGTRRQLAQLAGMLRQGKILPATQTLFNALRMVLTSPLMKAERDEFAKLIADATSRLNNDPSLRKIYPLSLEYQPGAEKDLFESLKELLEILQEASLSEAEEAAKAVAAKKEAALAKGQAHLDAAEHDRARATFRSIADEYPDDGELKGDIGERVLKAGLFEDAADYLSAAVTLDPHALQHYNRLGIALRKLGRYDAAEEYYNKALPLAPDDPGLHFNIGRMYMEWGKWERAAEHGDKAFAARPDFVEARKLAEFSRRKLQGG